MDVSYSNDELAFRQQVRAFIRDNLDPAAIRGQRLSAASATDRAVFESWRHSIARVGLRRTGRANLADRAGPRRSDTFLRPSAPWPAPLACFHSESRWWALSL